MKKLFTLKTLTILLIVASIVAMFCVVVGWVKHPPYYEVHAEDDVTPGEPSNGTDSGDTTPSDAETDVKLEEILAKLNAQTASDYFKQNILPLLTGTGSALVAGLIALLPYIKNKNRRKQLEAYAATLQKANEDLDTLLKSTDPEAIKKAVDGLFGERATEIVNEMIKQIPIDNKRVNELATEIGTVNAKLDCLIKGATNAWAKSSAATAALTEVPEKSLLVEKEAENAKLKAYIRTQAGEEADKLIVDICDGKVEA